MYTKDAIRFALNLAEQTMFKSLEEIDDLPLTFPTQQGGCHPLWVLGHLTFIEGVAYEIFTGGENVAAEWAGLFGPDTKPTDEPGKYPSIDKVRARYLHLRQMNLQFLDSLSDADLDTPTPWQPKGVEEHFATRGKALLTVALHQMAHRGQITDAIRSAGRAVPITVGAD